MQYCCPLAPRRALVEHTLEAQNYGGATNGPWRGKLASCTGRPPLKHTATCLRVCRVPSMGDVW